MKFVCGCRGIFFLFVKVCWWCWFIFNGLELFKRDGSYLYKLFRDEWCLWWEGYFVMIMVIVFWVYGCGYGLICGCGYGYGCWVLMVLFVLLFLICVFFLCLVKEERERSRWWSVFVFGEGKEGERDIYREEEGMVEVVFLCLVVCVESFFFLWFERGGRYVKLFWFVFMDFILFLLGGFW